MFSTFTRPWWWTFLSPYSIFHHHILCVYEQSLRENFLINQFKGLLILILLSTIELSDNFVLRHYTNFSNTWDYCCCSVAKSCLTLWPHELQHPRLPYPSLSPGVCSNSCPLNQWCQPTTLSPVVPFSSCPQSFPASGSFSMSRLFASGGQSIKFQLQHPSFQYSGLISFRIDWLHPLALQGTLKSLI